VGVQKTVDGGETWTPARQGLTDPLIYTLAIDPRDGQTLYAGTYSSSVFKSTDGGTTWTRMSDGMPQNILVDALIIDSNEPPAPQTIYAGTWGYGVFSSMDGGGSWSQFGIGPQGDPFVYALAIDKVGQRLYAATSKSGVFQNELANGANWTRDWKSDQVAYTLAARRSIIYVGTNAPSGDKKHGVYARSADGQWAPLVDQPGTGPVVRGLTAAPDSCAQFSLLAGTEDGVWRYP
jgi:photosystem II stability/assembly factor-like uncharacterized protein